MKIDKQLQKECILLIKQIASKVGYKKIQNTIYKTENGNIVFVDFVVVDSEYLIYRINIKKESYDNIFWRIMRMEENINESYSLRITGAFAAPAALIADGKVELSENVDMIAKNFFKKVDGEITTFLEKNDVTQYIFSNNVKIDVNILRCLSYIESGSLLEAKKLAETQIISGDRGRFKNEGKGFFELVLLYHSR